MRYCKAYLSLIRCSKAKRSVSVLKEQAKAAENQVKARSGSAAGSGKMSAGKATDGGHKGERDSKEPAKKVSKVSASGRKAPAGCALHVGFVSMATIP